jgi:hypothetical protein
LVIFLDKNQTEPKIITLLIGVIKKTEKPRKSEKITEKTEL